MTAEKLGIDTEEISYQAYDETRSGTQQDYLEAARTALKSVIAAVERSNGDSRQDAGQPGAAASQEGLTAPSQADILAQRDRAADGEKANTSQRPDFGLEADSPKAMRQREQDAKDAQAEEAAKNRAAGAGSGAGRAATGLRD